MSVTAQQFIEASLVEFIKFKNIKHGAFLFTEVNIDTFFCNDLTSRQIVEASIEDITAELIIPALGSISTESYKIGEDVKIPSRIEATYTLPKPVGVDFCEVAQLLGITGRVVRAFDVNTDTFVTRIDVLYKN